MLTDIVKASTGFNCSETDDSGECIEVFAPRPFEDDPEIFLYVQKLGDMIEISDCTKVLLHHGNCAEAIDQIASIVRAAGLEFTNGTIRLVCNLEGLGPAVTKFLTVMAELAAHERDFSRLSAQSWFRDQALAAK